MRELFPGAILTLSVRHAQQRLWAVGRLLHKEGSEELKAWVEDLKTFVYAGRAAELVERLRGYCRQVALHGPGTHGWRAMDARNALVRERRAGVLHLHQHVGAPDSEWASAFLLDRGD